MTDTAVPRRLLSWSILLLAITASAVSLWPPAGAWRETFVEAPDLGSIPAPEFSRLVRDLSEEGGYFRSDNFTSNETSYLHVVGKLREMRLAGGAYVGVGPEQNFTYIARLRPHIAFIVDIRRQAMLQHLMYKAIFHRSENRAEFLSLLLSRPAAGRDPPGADTPLREMVEYFASAPESDEFFEANLAEVLEFLEEDLKVPLSEEDRERIRYVYSAFHEEGLQIAFRIGGSSWGGGYRRFPNLGDLILQPDLDGKLGNFMASEEDFQFVRGLHRQNRIIPVVGDFAGSKALAAVADYLKKNRYIVRAFYTSNVEQFLFQNGVFGTFVENVRKLPTASDSVFIRAVPSRYQPHPAYVPGHRTATVLQKIPVFLEDYDDGTFTDYRRMVTTHFISGNGR